MSKFLLEVAVLNGLSSFIGYGNIEKGWSTFIRHHSWNRFQSQQRFVEVLKSKSTHLYGSKFIVSFLGIILLGNYVP